MNFESLANEHKDSVYRQMIRACGNREDAEDVLVEALLKAYGHLQQLRDVQAFRAWLAHIARRVCWQLKARQTLLPLMQLAAVDEQVMEIPAAQPTPEQMASARQMKELLMQAVSKLPPHYREVYELRAMQELPARDVVRQLGISLAAMKSRLRRARELVRQNLDASLIPEMTVPSPPPERAAPRARRKQQGS